MDLPLHDTPPDGTVTVATIADRYRLTPDAVKARLRKRGAPEQVGRLNAPSHPRLYRLNDVDTYFRQSHAGQHVIRDGNHCPACAADSDAVDKLVAAAVDGIVADPGTTAASLAVVAEVAVEPLARELLAAIVAFHPDPAPGAAIGAHVKCTAAELGLWCHRLEVAGLVEKVNEPVPAYRFVG